MLLQFNGKRVKITDTFVDKLFNVSDLQIKRTFETEPYSLFFGTEQIQLPQTNISIYAEPLGTKTYDDENNLTEEEARFWIEAYLTDCDLFFLARSGGGIGKDETTDDLAEGVNNLYFTTQRAKDALAYNTGLFALSGTPTFTATTAPSGATNHKICWAKSGGVVMVWGWLNYATQGTGVTLIQIPMPVDLPTPIYPSYMETGNIAFGSANIGTTITAINAYGIYCAFRFDITNKGTLTIGQPSNNCKFVQFSFSYNCAI